MSHEKIVKSSQKQFFFVAVGNIIFRNGLS